MFVKVCFLHSFSFLHFEGPDTNVISCIAYALLYLF